MGKPEIRFKGYTDEWEQRKLEECLSEITYGFTNPMSDTEEGPWKITAKDILDGMINYSSARHTSQIEYDDLTNKSKPLVGDLLLTKDGTLGRTAIVDAENVCINQSVALLRFNEKCSVQYAKTLLDTPMYQKQMLDDAGGGTIKHIYITKVDKMFISVPCMKEQERLVLFFNNLDNLITLHQRKCDEVKSLKKYMLQKIFPQNKQKVPEIRFEGFTEAWEQRKLGELAEIVGGGTPSTSMNSYWDGDIDWYAPAEIGEQIYLESSQRKITEEGLNKSSAKILPIGTVLFTSRAGIGKTAILLKEGCTNQGFQSIVPNKEKLDSYFIFTRSEELKRYGEIVGAGSTFVEVSGKQMANMELMMPKTMSEQQQIGEYFQILDHLITLHQQKCEELKKIKKFMLQKMFV